MTTISGPDIDRNSRGTNSLRKPKPFFQKP